MKKFVKSLVATFAAVLVFGMTVSAAGSSSAGGNDNIVKSNAELTQSISKAGATKCFDKNNQVYDLKFVALSEEEQKEVQAFATEKGLGSVVAYFDMTISGGEAPWTVQLALKGVVKKGDAFTVLHKVNGSYEIINAVAIDDNILQFQTSSASPFAIVTGTATATSVVAPKTGEVIALSAILAIVMMAGAALCAKKARLQK